MKLFALLCIAVLAYVAGVQSKSDPPIGVPKLPISTLKDPHFKKSKEGSEYRLWIGQPGKNGEDGRMRDGSFHRKIKHGPIDAEVQMEE